MLFQILLAVVGLFVALFGIFLFNRKKNDRDIPGYLRTPKVKGPLPIINLADEFCTKMLGFQLVKYRRAEWLKLANEVATIPGAEAIFGDQSEFHKGMTLFINEIRDDLLSASGRFLLNGLCRRVLNARKSVVKYCIDHPEIMESEIKRPIIITGLGRTGSTLLYNLMACDPKARAPRFYEISHMAEPVPPVNSAAELDTHPRIQDVMNYFTEIEKNYPNLFQEAGKSHRSHPAEIEEDLLILFQAAIFQLHIPVSLGKKRPNKYREWFFDDTNKASAYRYHKRFLQMMDSKFQPESHWLLKAPMHCTYMNAMMKEYPDARIVFTHRDPLAVNPSWVKLMESYIGWDYADNVCDRKFVAKHFQEAHLIQVERMIEWKKEANRDQYFELNYDSFIKDPVAAVAKIYEHFGLECTDEFKDRMRQWHADNRQGKYGRAPYTLEEYGFTEEQTRRDFAAYYDQCLGVAF